MKSRLGPSLFLGLAVSINNIIHRPQTLTLNHPAQIYLFIFLVFSKGYLGTDAFLDAGEWRRRRNISTSISLTSKFTSFSAKCPSVSLNRLCYQGLWNSGRTMYNSSTDDDFSELGPPMAGNSAAQLKLVTQKPEPFVPSSSSVCQKKIDSTGIASVSRPFRSHCGLKSKDFIRNLDKSSQASKSSLQDHNDASVLAVNRKSSSNIDNITIVDQRSSQKMDISCSVSIENIPSTISLANLVQAVSVFGKVSSARIRSVPDGLDCCDVDFENSESTTRAVLAGVITVEGIHLPIRPLHSSEIVTIRIQGTGKETTDPMIISICKSIGALEGLAKAGNNAVDAFFRVKNDADLQRIAKRLNNTIIDDCCWSAYQLPSSSTTRTMSEIEDAKSKLGLQMNNRLVQLKRQLDSKKVYYEDLQLLHLGILHLERLPTTINLS